MMGEAETSDDGVADFGKWLIWFGIQTLSAFYLATSPKVLHPWRRDILK
jgi:hypothetical protein